MLFNSYLFLFAFLPAALTLWWSLVHHRRLRLLVLTLASYLFYGYGGWWYCFLIFASTVIDYTLADRINRTEQENGRRSLLLLSISSNLGLLAVFKYLGFFTENLNLLIGAWDPAATLTVPQIVLPIGISFFTFQSMSYTIDVYRRRVEPAPDFVSFAAYVSLFPQLIAGPIVRYSALEGQLRIPPTRFDSKVMALGLRLFVLGLAKKLLIADVIAREIDPLYASQAPLGFQDAWLAALGYTFQIYFDFSGYSDMAVGLGRMLGFEFPINFRSPYKATSISDFWRRWHITLSEWLRDYLYIPLGGSRRGTGRAAVNACLTFLLGGLWHGASWNFVLWGLYHGALLALHRLIEGLGGGRRLPPIVARAMTFSSVVFGWTLFRSDTVSAACMMWQSMLGLAQPQISEERILLLFMILTAGSACWLLPNSNEMRPRLGWLSGIVLGLLFVACLLSLSRPSPFLYFRF